MTARRRRSGTRQAPSVLGIRDLADEALTGILARPARSALTVIGVLLGVTAFVAVLGLTSTAAGQISRRFTVLSATEVTVTDAGRDTATADFTFPADAETRLARLNGVVASGTTWEVPLPAGSRMVSAHPPTGTSDGSPVPVLAATPGYLRAIHSRVLTGRLYDAFHQGRAERVCVLGVAAARQLGISRVDMRPAIFVGDVPLVVIGIVADVDREAQTLLSVLVPSSTAQHVWGVPQVSNGQPARMIVETRLGAAQLIGGQVRYALRPDDPARLTVTVPPDPRELRDQVNTDLRTLFLALAGICLLVGAVGIANTTLVAVLERVAEIGLRRSLGARPRHIALQFLAESAALGLLGGVVGTGLGTAAVAAVAAARQWTPILDPTLVLPAPLVGLVVGVLAGLYPAWRAGRIEPVEALRR